MNLKNRVPKKKNIHEFQRGEGHCHIGESLLYKYKQNSYLLFLRINTQKQPDRKNKSAIMKYRAGKGISPALRKFPLLISDICICKLYIVFITTSDSVN